MTEYQQAAIGEAQTPLEIIEAYWAKHDPDGTRRVRLTTRPEMRAESTRALARRLDEEWRRTLPKVEPKVELES